MQILQPKGWVRPRGYSNGVAARGKLVFVAGMVGWDAECRFVAHDFVGQAAQALRNAVEVLAQAGARPEHIVRMTWYIVDKQEYLTAGQELGRAFREIIGSYNATMTAIQVAALMEDQARVEIECTAVVPD